MASHLLGKKRRPRPYRTRRLRDRRTAIIASIVVLALFVAALLLWIGNGDDSDAPDVAGPTGVSSTADGTGPSASPTASPSAAGTLPALPGFGSVGSGGPNSTDLTALGPGSHRVVLTARSNSSMLAVAYAIRGEKQGKIFYNVKSPVVITRTMTGGRPFAAMALQVSNVGTTGSCTITIDGKVVDSRHINKSYAVMGCAA